LRIERCSSLTRFSIARVNRFCGFSRAASFQTLSASSGSSMKVPSISVVMTTP